MPSNQGISFKKSAVSPDNSPIILPPFMVKHVSFEETIGIYDGTQSIIDSTLTDIYELRNKYPESDGNSNYGGWQKQLGHEYIKSYPIKLIIEKEFREYIKYYAIKEPSWLEFIAFFCNINPPGSSNTMHHHAMGEFSGAFWLQADKEAGDLIVMNPFYNRFLNTCAILQDNSCYNSKHFEPQVNKGVFFNSSLVHYVDINRSQRDRVAIGYNIGIHY